MKLTFLGGADEVGASGTLVEIAGKRILVDCGIRPSPKARWGLEGDQLPALSLLESGGALDFILVTHAHTDHTGALELVVSRFPGIPVIATPPTVALARVLHADARRIMQTRLDEEGDLPLFDDVAVERLLAAFQPAPFRQPVKLSENLAATFYPAGHIAGAAMIALESGDGSLLFTGDLSISPQRTVDGAKAPPVSPDALVIESTYGGRLHANRAVQEKLLVKTIRETVEAGGKVLIPAFALGRAQEILLTLAEFRRRGELPNVPVWADGMVRAICAAYTTFPEALPLALQERISPDQPGSPFFDAFTRPVESRAQRNSIVWEPGPCIIVASSGMLAGGPALEYARALAGQPQHAILLTGYQDEESPGRRLQEMAEKGRGTIRLGKDKVDVACRLGAYSLSAHADEGQLLSLIETIAPGETLLVHGDEAARASLERALAERQRPTRQPHAGQTIEINRPHRSSRPVRSSVEDDRQQRRRAQIASYGNPVGQWLLLKAPSGGMRPARCLAIEDDHLLVQAEDDDSPEPAWPDDILTLVGGHPPAREIVAAGGAASPTAIGSPMEPNQALAQANRQFPPEARLRKAGYRLAEAVLVLTFDFPDAAREKYAPECAHLEATTGWRVEITPEANQNALNALVRETLPEGWQIVKGPAIHRDEKRVAVVVAPFPLSPIPSSKGIGDRGKGVQPSLEPIAARFRAASGYELTVALAAPTAAPVIIPVASRGERLEINAAYSLIKSGLEGSTLYRASQKGDEIVLSFISPQVGARYREEIESLSQQTGWPLNVNPQPNQGAILEIARALLNEAGWSVAKGPSIFPEKGETSVALVNFPEEADISEIADSFESQTGFRLIVTSQTQTPAPAAPRRADEVVEIPIHLIRLRPHQQALALDPEKLLKAVDRARRMGITPPIVVRRARDFYVLVDGLYRLRAAEAIGLARIPAEVE